MKAQEIQILCVEWQKILRLQDWDVEVEFVRKSELEDADAECFPILLRKEAKIKILDPIDFYGERLKGSGSPENLEMLLIHELLHLHFEPFWDNDGEEKELEMEQAIHSLAKSLVFLKNSHESTREISSR